MREPRRGEQVVVVGEKRGVVVGKELSTQRIWVEYPNGTRELCSPLQICPFEDPDYEYRPDLTIVERLT